MDRDRAEGDCNADALIAVNAPIRENGEGEGENIKVGVNPEILKIEVP